MTKFQGYGNIQYGKINMTKYTDINIYNAKVDDNILQSLNNLSLLLGYGDYFPFGELETVKLILDRAYSDYQKIQNSLLTAKDNAATE